MRALSFKLPVALLVAATALGSSACDAGSYGCSVSDNADGTHTLTCEDGSQTTFSDGVSGVDGVDGVNGEDGANGEDGESGGVGALLEGSFTIKNSADVAMLQEVEEITGSLLIDASGLGSLSLPKLQRVGTHLEFRNNTFDTFDMPALVEVGGNVLLYNNSALVSIESLDGLDEIPGALQVSGSPLLVSLEGLEGVTSVGSWLTISAPVTDLLPLSNLTSAGALTIQSNTLTDLSGLDALTTVDGSVNISQNTTLESLSGLDALTTVGGGLSITNNPALTDLGLGKLDTVALHFHIYTNASLCQDNVLAAFKQVTAASTAAWSNGGTCD
jgi:hypothetical protein